MRLKGCLFQTVGWGCCCGNPFHGSGTSEHQGGAWRRPGRQQAHRCPGPSSCLPRQIKSGLLFSPFSPQRARQSPSPFSLLRLFSLLFPFFLLGLWSGIGFAGRMTEAGSARRHRRGWGGPRAGASAVHSALCFPSLRHSWPGLAWPCSHRAWLSALTLITVYLSEWPSHNSSGPRITKKGG